MTRTSWIFTTLMTCLLASMSGCGNAEAIVIGSKNFTEQVILGELLAQQIENQTELQVVRKLNLGGTFICDQALRAGELDGRPEVDAALIAQWTWALIAKGTWH